MNDFSLESPDFTHYLTSILRRYPLGGQILKELLQNAEDSGASELKFFIDRNEYPTINLLNQELAKFQGPALIAYNNAQFDDSDWKSIRNIEKSEKSDKPLKIGKFGLGFNSIYHITDLPTIVSGNKLAIFDPHERYFRKYNCSRGIQFDFNNLNHQEEIIKRYSDQFASFAPFNHMGLDLKSEFKGSLFRFPIRNREAAECSKLSSNYQELDILIYDEILSSFFKDLRLILVFLKNLERVEVYEIENGSNEHRLLASTWIDFEASSQDLREKRALYKQMLERTVDPKDRTMSSNAFQLDDIHVNFKMVIRTKVNKPDRITKYDQLDQCDQYLMTNCVRLRSASKELKELAKKTATLPICSLSYRLNESTDMEILTNKFNDCRYFCFLPMPETIEKSGLPFHINGSFGLRDDRSDFKWMSNDCHLDESAQWNELMVNEVLNRTLIEMIDYAKSVIIESNGDFGQLINFYYLLPIRENMSKNWREWHLKTFFRDLSEFNLILNRSNEWVNIRHVWLTNNIEASLKEFSDKNEVDFESMRDIVLGKCFDAKILPKICIPDHLIQIFKEFNKEFELKFIDLNDICKAMKSINDQLNDNERQSILSYLIQSVDDLEMLNGIKLIPLCNKIWTEFDSSRLNEIFFFIQEREEKAEASYQSLFEPMIKSSIFDRSKLDKASSGKLIDLLERNQRQIVIFSPEKHFKSLLQKSISTGSLDQMWLEKVWSFISRISPNSLNEFQDLSIILHDSETFSLNYGVSSSLTRFFFVDNSTDISQSVLDFIRTKISFKRERLYGCIIFDQQSLPRDLRVHKCFENYFKPLRIQSLIYVFQILNDNLALLNMDVTEYFERNFNSEGRIALVEHLNSINHQTFNQNRIFSSIVKDKLPIFRLFNTDQFVTAKSVGYYVLESVKQESLKSIPLDPRIKLIDPVGINKLIDNLKLTKYPLDDLLEKSIDYFSSDFDKMISILDWCLLNQPNINAKLLSKSIYRNKSGQFLNLSSIYDPRDRFVKAFIAEELHLHPSLNKEPFYSTIASKLAGAKDIQVELFVEFIRKISVNRSYEEEIKQVFDYLDQCDVNKRTVLIQHILDIKWIRALDKQELYSGQQLWQPDCSDLIGHVEPIVDQNVIPIKYFSMLRICVKSSIKTNQVVRNLRHMIDNSMTNTKELDAIYSYLNDNSEEAKRCLSDEFSQSIGYVYDGMSHFYLPEQVLLKSELNGLEPFYIALNETSNFIKKHRNLYSETFGVKASLDLECLIDLIEKLSNDASNQKMNILNKSLLIGSIFDLIDKKYLDELKQSSELITRLRLPVCSESNEQAEFEKVDNCVYLIETDEKDDSEFDVCKKNICQEKGYKLVDKRLSIKLLKRLGVASFTEKIFDMEFIEPYGQYEDLVDRLHTLLNGYKDGLSIFKETIQNADDAGATVVKYCYDMRQNDKWRNPKMLLDSNMAKAQGPALFVYNNATFSDEDFTNIIKLGSGSKKSQVDKIGKFGLGFNALYNISDTPSIISRSSIFYFDPTMTFMPNRIRDRSRPGVRINFNKNKSKHLSLYSDQFKPYDNIFGCKIFENEINYQGTLIRLPLRNEPSRISRTLYNSNSEMAKLFEIVFKNADSLLLFTQSVQRIEIYVLCEDETKSIDDNMKLLFKLDKSLVGDYYKKHSIHLGLNDEFSNQTSLLKAASVLLKQQQSLKKLETSFKLRTQIELGEVSLLSAYWSQPYSSHSSEWLLISSFDPNYLDFTQSSNKCIPCVGMAIRANNEQEKPQKEGQAFCFLPLAIETGLNYHINATFVLSEDRTRLLELSKEDKQNDKEFEYKWNEYLLEPLVENLILMIQTIIEKNSSIKNIIELTWPLNNKIPYFNKFEDKFYNIICSRSILIFPTIDVYEDNLWTDYQSSIFIDFRFNDDSTHSLAVNTLKLILRNQPTKKLVEIPNEYLNKLRDLQRINQTNSIDKGSLLNRIIDHREEINLKDYENLLMCYLTSGEESFLEIIKSRESIPTCGGIFKRPNDLLNPDSNKHFRSLFETSENMFPTDRISSDSQVLAILEKLGTKSRKISNELIINRGNRIYSLYSTNNKQQAKNLSNHLLLYLNDSQSFDDQLRNALANIKWLFAMKKPSDWHLPWFESSHPDAIYQYSDLFPDEDKNLIGCIKPVISDTFNFLLTRREEKERIELVISQFKLLSEFLVKNFSSLEVESIQQLNTFFQAFYIRLQKYTTENDLIQETEQENRIQWLKETLPQRIIYCPGNKIENKFLGIDSFALEIEYECEPHLMKLPAIDHRSRNFFERLGVKERFTLDMLNKYLHDLKASNRDQPLNKESAERCIKILEEMAKDNSIKEFLPKQDTFYILDENNVLRDIKQLYSDVTKSKNSILKELSELNLHLVNTRVNSSMFNVKDLKSMVFSRVGELFGQNEILTDRIKDILKRYSNQFCLFKEFIQNADDAGATEIAFIVDSRKLETNKTFGKNYNRLQGESLLCWNNAVFTEADLKGLKSLSSGSKRDETAKIGRFGVGFNSVYHYTDAPQLLSDNSDYVIFDPLCAHISDLETTNSGLRIRNMSSFFQNDGIYADVASGFQVPGFDLNKSTMFRLALRQTHSNICMKTYSDDEIKRSMRDFIQSDDEFLAFLNNVSKVFFYEYSGKGRDVKLIGQKSIEFPNSYEKQKRDDFHNQMRRIMYSKIPTEPKSVCYSTTIKQEPGNFKKDLIVLEQYEFDKTTQIQIESINELKSIEINREKFFPFGGIALNIDYFKNPEFVNNSKLFNFLALDQSSPLVPHINAYWSLHQENRQKIYEYSMRTENVDKETAKWCTNWNKCLINCIILPLYIRLLRFLKENYHQFNISTSRYLKLFPKLPEDELKPYFEQMFTSFYQQVFELEFLPVKTRNNNVHWFKPSEMKFTRDLNNFLHSIEHDNYNAIYEIIEAIGINLCSENLLIDLFESHGVQLAVLNPDNIIDRLKEQFSQLVDKKVDETLLKSIENVKFLLDYNIRYQKEKQNINTFMDAVSLSSLESVPLEVNQNGTLTVFSSTNKLIIHDEPNLFRNHEHRFLHKRLYNIFNREENHIEYLRKMSIEDLAFLLPSILDANTYLNSEYVEASPSSVSRIKEREKAWEQISNCLKPDNNDIHQLEPIKNWSLIPVRKSSRLFLAPIKDHGIILQQTTSLISNILSEIDYPILNKWTIPDKLDKIRNMFDSVVVSVSKNEDLLQFFERQKHCYEKIFTKDENKRNIFKELSKCIEEVWSKSNRNTVLKFKLFSPNSIQEFRIRSILRNLPIYEDIFKRFGTLNNVDSYFIDMDQLPFFIKEKVFTGSNTYYEDLLDFANHMKLNIMNKGSYSLFFEYLGIQEIKIDRLYELFFNWAKESNQTSLMKILKDHVLLTKHITGLYESSLQLFEILKDLAFIRIGEKYYKANECYDGFNDLLKFAYPEKLLPKEYQNYEWRDHFIKLGFNVSCTANDCLAVANKFASLDRDFDKDEIRIYQQLLERMNEIDDSSLMAQIKDIKFLPSEFTTNHDSEEVKLLRKIHDPSYRLICMSGSALATYKSLVWIQKPILPGFCKLLKDNKYYKNLGIDIEPSIETILDNFNAMIELLTSSKPDKANLLNKLSAKKIGLLEAILQSYYSKFSNSNSLLIKSDIKMVMVENKCITKELTFIEPSLLVKNMNPRDQIDRYIYKIPPKCEKYWDMFKSLGANEKISYEQCRQILDDYYTENKSKPLSDELYNNVLIVSKLLYYDGVASTKADDNKHLYLPNMLRIMRPLVSLFYKDNSYYESLIGKSDEIHKICLFDVNDFVRVVERSINDEVSSGNENRDNESPPPLKRRKNLTLKDKMIWQISWKSIFQQEYSNEPRPLSEILSEVILDMSSLHGSLNEAKTADIRSFEFCESVLELVKDMDENFAVEQEDNEEKAKEVIRSIEIYTNLNAIKTCIRDKRNREVISNSERDKTFVCLKEDGKVKFCARKGTDNSYKFNFFLSEVILEALQTKLPHLKILNDNAKIQRNFILVVSLLLKSNSRIEYKAIVSEYKSNKFLTI